VENACGPSDPTPWGNQGPSYASRARETLPPIREKTPEKQQRESQAATRDERSLAG
jgi:hypothetical protein